MNLQNIIKDTSSFEEVKSKLENKPYNLSIKDTENVYIVRNNPKLELLTDISKECNGIIIEKETNKMLCYGYNCMITGNNEDLLSKNIGEHTIQKAIDGTIIRMYYYNNEWWTCTNRSIDAKKTHWISEKSFDELFKEASNKLDRSILNKQYTYIFILRHPENRHISKIISPEIIYIGSRNMDTLEIVYDENLNDFKKCENIYFNTWQDMINELRTGSYDIMGFIITDKDGGMTKYISDNFKLVKELKGNIPDMYYRCLILYIHNRKDEFINIFPEYKSIFKFIDKKINILCKQLYSMYVNRYIKKRTIKVIPEYNMIINHLHKDYIESFKTEKKKITYIDVCNKIKGYSPLRVYNMIK